MLRHFLYLIILISFSARAESPSKIDTESVITFGGGCGGVKTLQSFIAPFEERARSRGSDVISSFHASDIPTADSSAPGTEVDLLKKLDEVIAKYQKSKRLCAEKQCQFLLNISSHGYPSDFARGGVAHSVCGADGKKVDLAKVRIRLVELNRLGVKIGVVDESCFSGGSLDLFGDVACVVSAASRFLPHNSPSKSASFGRSLKDLPRENSSLLDLSINQLLHVSNNGKMQNSPLVSSGKDDLTLAKLNELSDKIGQSMKADIYREFLKEVKSKTPEEIRALASSCQTLVQKYLGKPLEVVMQDPTFKQQGFDSRAVKYCGKITLMRNHLTDLGAGDWNEIRKQKFLQDVSCELVGDQAIELFAREALRIATEAGSKGPLKSFAETKEFDALAAQFRFSCSEHLSDSSQAVIVQEIKSGSECVSFCDSYLSNFATRKNPDRFYVASVCLNKLKAIHLLSQRSSTVNLCAKFQL